MKMDLDKALGLLKESGCGISKPQQLNETTATTAPDYVFGNKIYDALEAYIEDIKQNMADDPECKDVGEKLIAVINKALDDGELMTKAIDQLLDTIGFNQAYEKAWDEHHGR